MFDNVFFFLGGGGSSWSEKKNQNKTKQQFCQSANHAATN